MKKRIIINDLKNIAKEKVYCDEEKKNAIIATVMEKELPIRKMDGFKEFLLSQFGFMNKNVFFWQVMWILLFFYMVWKGAVFHFAYETLYILSMAPPLLLLLTVEAVSHVYNRSMLEIEYATKYSIKKVVMVRMLILSMINGAMVAAGVVFAKKQTGLELLELLAYSLTPLILMTCILLALMKKWKGEQLKYAGISVYFCFAIIVMIGRTETLNIYRQNLLGIWLLFLVSGTVAAMYQFRSFLKHLDCFELLTE